MSTPTLYTVDIGFNWNAPVIGSAFEEGIGFYPLQWAVIDPNGSTPAWATQMKNGDSLRFHLTDITSSSGQTPASVANTVQSTGSGNQPLRTVNGINMTFGNPSDTNTGFYPFAQEPSGIYDSSVGSSALPGLVYGASSILFQPTRTQSAVYCQANPKWQVARWYVGTGSGGDQFTFDAECFVEFSVQLTVSDGATTRQFIFDPEFFVGATDG